MILQRVMELQQSKEDLAGTLFSSDGQSGNATRLEVSFPK
jgi:hypothetical protein